jgi:hypothetical protein
MAAAMAAEIAADAPTNVSKSLEYQVGEIAVDKRVRDKAPDIGPPASRPYDVRHGGRIVAGGNEGKQGQELVPLLFRQRKGREAMNNPKQDGQDEHH